MDSTPTKLNENSERTHFATDGTFLYARLLKLVNSIKADAPLEALTILTASPLASRTLRNRLTRDVTGGLFDVQFLQMGDIARRLGGGTAQLANRAPISDAQIALALDKVIQTKFKGSAAAYQQPAFMQYLINSFKSDTGRGEVKSIVNSTRAALSTTYYDYRELADAAAHNVAGLAKLPKTIMLIANIPHEDELNLWLKIANLPHTEKLVLLSGETTFDERICELLKCPVPNNLPDSSSAFDIQFRSVANQTDEKAAVMSGVLEQIRSDTKKQNIAVLCPSADHCDNVARALAMEGLPVATPIADRDKWLLLREFVDLTIEMATDGVNLNRFKKWLKATPLKVFTATTPTLLSAWLNALKKLPRDKPELWVSKLNYQSSKAEEAPALANFVGDFLRDVGALFGTQKSIQKVAFLSDWVSWLQTMVACYSGAIGTDIFDELAREMLQLDRAEKSVKISANLFQQIFEHHLRGVIRRHTPRKEGIMVLQAGDVPGVLFDAIHIVGMVSGNFPNSNPTADDLLGELSSKKGLAQRQAQLALQKGAFWNILRGASKIAFYWPKFDGERETFPSEWFVELLKQNATDGETAPLLVSDLIQSSESLVENYNRTARHIKASSADFGTGKMIPVSANEYNLLVATDKTDIEPNRIVSSIIQAAQKVLEARRDRDNWSIYEGNLSSVANLLKQPQINTSAYRWQNFLRCPYEYFLENILGITVEQEYDEQLRIEPRDKGTVVHDILEALFEHRTKNNQTELVFAEQLPILDAIAEKHLAKAPENFYCGPVAFWQYEKRLIKHFLNRWLDIEINEHYANGWRQASSELAFGTNTSSPHASVETEEGTTIRFSGRIDRIDVKRTEPNQQMVIDYKTGKSTTDAKLQLAIYIAAMMQKGIGDEAVFASAWYLMSANHRDARLDYTFDSVDGLSLLKEVSAHIVRCINAGLFIAGTKHCKFCADLQLNGLMEAKKHNKTIENNTPLRQLVNSLRS